ncbi:hypothetical protein [Paenibacillus tepidiphilus]|nr:hypothetical protein [Paenibacillus tepidiphilus]
MKTTNTTYLRMLIILIVIAGSAAGILLRNKEIELSQDKTLSQRSYWGT